MASLEVECPSCKQTHTLHENSTQYLQAKAGTKTRFHCEDCNHKIRMDAVKQNFTP